MPDSAPASKPATVHDSAGYTVVARRYRPKSFQELVGQEHISQALAKAISTGRVGHAYLFTGARGVGKTSSARIFAKALNAPGGPTSEPADDSDVSQAIDSGEDVDVIEIDAASNRGIDEIRQLRANVTVRPSRSRYKIYIIDEVHMLTHQAFNALLKTLEEPPEHVKFIFCTTDPEKVPITVLSRCQRFDFAPVRPDAIKQRLAEICEAEGFAADDEALALLARRAAGSMRDSQSLLEQVMSFSSGKITIDQVHTLLGTADESRLRELAEALADRNGVAALTLVDQAVADGTDAGQFAEQTLGYLRDLMAVAVGGGPDLLKVCNPTSYDQLKQLAGHWGLQTILAAVQLLDEALVRMRFSVQSQALFEVSLIQITQLQDLATIAKIIEAVQHGGAAPTPTPRAGKTASSEKKNIEGLNLPWNGLAQNDISSRAVSPPSSLPTSPSIAQAAPLPSPPHAAAGGEQAAGAATSSSVSASRKSASGSRSVKVDQPTPTIAIHAAPPVRIDPSTVRDSTTAPAGSASTMSATPSISAGAQAALQLWKKAASANDGMLADFAGNAIGIEMKSVDNWVVLFPPGTRKSVEYCEVPARKAELQSALDKIAGRTIQFGFRVQPGHAVRTVSEVPVSPTVARSQRMRQLAEHPLVSKLCELLQGEVVRVDPPAADRATDAGTTNLDSRETAGTS